MPSIQYATVYITHTRNILNEFSQQNEVVKQWRTSTFGAFGLRRWGPRCLAERHGDLVVSVGHGVEEKTGRTLKSKTTLEDFVALLEQVS